MATTPSLPQPAPASGSPSRRNALQAGLAAGGLVLGGGAIITGLHIHAQRRQDRFKQLIHDNPLTGNIAYARGAEICILDASQFPDSKEPVQVFQAPHRIIKMAWLNPHELVFTSQAHAQNPLGTPDAGRRSEITIVSHGVFKLNRDDKTITRLFDPYSEEAKALFGNVQQRDADKEREQEESMNKKEGNRVSVIAGDFSALQVTELKIDPTELKAYANILDTWYRVDRDGKGIQRAVQLPVEFHDQSTNKSGMFKLQDSMWGPALLTDGHSEGISLGKHAGIPVWYDR